MAWVDDLGVNVHPSTYARYADVSSVLGALEWLGVKWVRIDGPSHVGDFVSAGLSVVCMCTSAAQATQALAAGAVAIESTNEPDLNSISASAAKSTGQAIVAAVAGAVPVLTSGLGTPDDPTSYASAMGDIGEDLGNIHYYRADASDATWAANKAVTYKALPYTAANKDFWVTETGTHDLLFQSPPPGHVPTPDYVVAETIAGTLSGIMADTPAGTTGRCKKIFWYELVSASQANQYETDNNIQHYFGITYPTFVPKSYGFQIKEILAS